METATAQLSTYDQAAVAAYASHSTGCQAAAEQCAAENGATEGQVELWAALYLADGTLTCSCH
jgi:hypothetical protein